MKIDSIKYDATKKCLLINNLEVHLEDKLKTKYNEITEMYELYFWNELLATFKYITDLENFKYMKYGNNLY